MAPYSANIVELRGASQGKRHGPESPAQSGAAPALLEPCRFPTGAITKCPKSTGLKQQASILSQFWKSDGGRGRTTLTPRAPRRKVHAAPAPGDSQQSLAFLDLRRHGPLFASIFTWPSFFSVSLCLLFLLQGHPSLESGPTLLQYDLILSDYIYKALLLNRVALEFLGGHQCGGIIRPVHLHLLVGVRALPKPGLPMGCLSAATQASGEAVEMPRLHIYHIYFEVSYMTYIIN